MVGLPLDLLEVALDGGGGMTGDVSDDPGLFDGGAERDDAAAGPDGPVGGREQLGVVGAGMPEEIRFVLGGVGID